jgi:hypothetical protein
MSSGVVRHNPGQGCFADSWWTMQDQIANPVGFDCSLEEATFGQDPLLPLKFLQSSWTHAICQWCKPPALLFSVEGEKTLTHHRSVNKSSVVDKNRVNVITGNFLRIPF